MDELLLESESEEEQGADKSNDDTVFRRISYREKFTIEEDVEEGETPFSE